MKDTERRTQGRTYGYKFAIALALATAIFMIWAGHTSAHAITARVCPVDNQGNANQCEWRSPATAEYALTAHHLAIALPPRTIVYWGALTVFNADRHHWLNLYANYRHGQVSVRTVAVTYRSPRG